MALEYCIRIIKKLEARFLTFFKFFYWKKLHWSDDDNIVSTIYSDRMAFSGFPDTFKNISTLSMVFSPEFDQAIPMKFDVAGVSLQLRTIKLLD